MNFVVDLGNTYAKVGIFERTHLVDHQDKLTQEELVHFINQEKPSHLLVSSVNHNTKDILTQLNKEIHAIELTYQTPMPIQLQYQTPETLGVDRIAAAVGAYQLAPGKNCLAIDMGTCITYDFIDAAANYQGGGISPGLSLRLKSLYYHTAWLPLVEINPETPLLGRSTQASIQSGVFCGTLAEIEEIASKYSKRYQNLQVIVCGGDANLFKNKLKIPALIVAELVLIGLNTILNHNVEI
ncbi:MAG: type III pantothenate kinase [Cytophagales bacterium]|nr:type III pantothenate kinase [Cytophagales bacterium]